jgi:hypothetical protein
MKIEIKTWQRRGCLLRGKRSFTIVGNDVPENEALAYFREAARHHGPSQKIVEVTCDGKKVVIGWLEHGIIYLQACRDQVDLAHKVARSMSYEKATRLDEYKTAYLYYCGIQLVLS